MWCVTQQEPPDSEHGRCTLGAPIQARYPCLLIAHARLTVTKKMAIQSEGIRLACQGTPTAVNKGLVLAALPDSLHANGRFEPFEVVWVQCKQSIQNLLSGCFREQSYELRRLHVVNDRAGCARAGC